MRRLLMLEPLECGSGDTTKNKIYNITKDMWLVWNEEKYDNDIYKYTEESVAKHPNGTRCITIKDDSDVEDSFEMDDNEDRFIITNNDKELAVILLDKIEGLDSAVVSMALLFNNKNK